MAGPTEESTKAPPRSDAGTYRHGFKRWIALALIIAGLMALGFVWYRGSYVDDHVYTAAELDAGPVSQIITWENGRTAVQISRLSPLSADHLWRVATDQGRFDEFMPYVRATTVRPGDDNTLIEEQWLDLPYGSYDLELTIRLVEDGNVRKARWEQSRGSLTYNQGAWVVEQHGDGAILRYQVSATLAHVPQWVVNFAMRRRLGRLLQAVETRVRDLEQREPGYFRP